MVLAISNVCPAHKVNESGDSVVNNVEGRRLLNEVVGPAKTTASKIASSFGNCASSAPPISLAEPPKEELEELAEAKAIRNVVFTVIPISAKST